MGKLAVDVVGEDGQEERVHFWDVVQHQDGKERENDSPHGGSRSEPMLEIQNVNLSKHNQTFLL